jgi:arginyl-tRNA synthetase
MHLLAERRAAIRAALEAALSAAGAAGALPAGLAPAFAVEEPKDGSHGDFACNVALLAAGAARRPPRAVAEALLRHLPAGAISDLERVEVAGPGFLNVFLRPGWLGPAVDEALAGGPAYGGSAAGAGRSVLVEFVSANPTGPLNVVNCRAAAYGDALVRCLRAAGYAAEAEYYVNDAGGQVRKLALSLRARLRERLGEPADIPEGGYPGEYLRDVAARYAAEHGMAILEAPEERQVAELGAHAVADILAGQRADLERFRVHYDHFTRESAVRATGAPEQVVAALSEGGHTARRDGALWLLSSVAGDNDDRVLCKSDGEFTYRVPDIAYHAEKFRRGYDRLIDILGQDHHGDVAGVRIALEWLGHPVERLEVLITQLIRLVRDGAGPERISKRGGNFVSMSDFLDEVGVDAARFFFLMRTLDTHMDFDIALARRRSQENPVYYVQYAHARISSILRQAGALPGPEGAAPLVHPAEVALCRAVAALPDEVLAAAEGRAPHRLTTYARVLAERFHTFYVQCRVLGEAPEITAARLRLCAAAGVALANTLTLMGVEAPERM